VLFPFTLSLESDSKRQYAIVLPAKYTLTLQKPEGVRAKTPMSEAVALYCDPLATPDLASSGFPGRVKK
jgi:hypothetical protein